MKIENNDFFIYQHALLSKSLPHENKTFDEREIKKILKSTRTLFFRYTSGATIPLPSENATESTDKTGCWWYCIKDEPIFWEKLSSKQRYRIRKGLNNTSIGITTPEEIERQYEEIYNAIVNSYSDYPKVYQPKLTETATIQSLKDASNSKDSDVWLCRNQSTQQIIGYALCTKHDDTMVNLTAVKIDPEFLKTEVNAALAYRICEHYINDLGYKYICDGERNIKHITSYQDFLIRVVGFRRAYCKLHIIYHPYVKPLINLLYPFRKLISKTSAKNKLLYNLSCILKQEEYHKCCNS